MEHGSKIAPGAIVYGDAHIGAATWIGTGAVVHGGTFVGRRCVIEDGAVLGKRPRLRPGSSARGGALGRLAIEDEVTICCGAIVYAGATVVGGAIIGDHAQIRERAVIGSSTVVGHGSVVDFDAIVGARVLIQTGAYITGGTEVEDEVFIGPGVITTNDHTMGRHEQGELEGPVLRRACRVGGGAVLVPGVEIGEEAFIAAGAVVTRDVAERAVVMGVPGRYVRRVPDEDTLERWR
jgi:acetyltransferase-like isoleucine patch superfamily enzyme